MDRTDARIAVGLRTGFERYDFAFPCSPPVRDEHAPIDLANLVPFPGRADRHTSPGHAAAWPGDGARQTVSRLSGYSHFLAWLARHVDPLPTRHDRLAWYLALPRQRTSIAALDAYIRDRLFDRPFDPGGDRWRLLLQPGTIGHIVRAFGGTPAVAPARATAASPRRLSEVGTISVSAHACMAVDKCIYTHLPVDPRDSERDRAFIGWAQADPGVQAFCGIGAQHGFVQLPYTRADGIADAVVPDFLVRMAAASYLVELHPRPHPPDARLRRQAAVAWCERANALPPAQRGGQHWYYAPLGDTSVPAWRRRARYLGDALAFAQWHAHYLARTRD